MLARQKREGDVVLKLIGHESRTYCYLIVYPEPFLGDQAPSKKMQEVPDFIW
jgi:hypothetical protein